MSELASPEEVLARVRRRAGRYRRRRFLVGVGALGLVALVVVTVGALAGGDDGGDGAAPAGTATIPTARVERVEPTATGFASSFLAQAVAAGPLGFVAVGTLSTGDGSPAS